jgi:hypothetical protein
VLLAWSLKCYLELRRVGCARSAAESAPVNHPAEGATQRGARSEPNAVLGVVAVLAACTALAWPSAGRAYTLRWTESGAAVRWNAELVTLRIDPVLSARMPQMQMAALVSESAAAWLGLENVPEVLVGDGAPGSPGYHKGRSSNGVYWIDDWSLVATRGGVSRWCSRHLAESASAPTHGAWNQRHSPRSSFPQTAWPWGPISPVRAMPEGSWCSRTGAAVAGSVPAI